jgi:hypothetical protein
MDKGWTSVTPVVDLFASQAGWLGGKKNGKDLWGQIAK